MIRQDKKNGFSLIEMLIALAIVAVISVMVSISVSSLNDKKRLEQGTANFLSLMQLTQSNALSGYVSIELAIAPNIGYGIHFDYPDLGDYFVFIDQANEEVAGDVDYKYDAEFDKIIENHILPSGVSFKDCVYAGSPTIVTGNIYGCDIVFLNQKDYAYVRIDSSLAAGVINTFILEDVETGEQKNISIKRWLGLIFQE